MAEEVFKLKTLDVDNTIARQTRVGFKNNPTSKLVFASPDTQGEFIYSGETGIYTGERFNNTEYLIQGSVEGNNIRTQATFTKDSNVVSLSSSVPGLKEGDIIRNDVDTTFFEIASSTGNQIILSTPYVSSNFEGTAYTGSATIRKEKIGNAEFEYVRSIDGENKIFFNEDNLEWGITGVEATGPVDTQRDPYVFPPDDYMVAQFQPSSSNGAPIVTAVKTDRFTVINDNKNTIPDLGLNAVPYPHETLKVYWGPKDGTLERKQENIDYVVNYSQDPEYQFPFPPQEDRQVAFLKFLESLDQKQATINENFNGYIAVSKVSEVSGAEDLVTAVTDIVPDSEEVRASNSLLNKNSDYIIDDKSGLITFVKHKNNESLVQSVSYPRSLLWDGVTVIKGVNADGVKGSLDPTENDNLVIRPISGLEGISETVYYEDTDANNVERDTDYLLEYDSGAFSLKESLEKDESVLLSYYVEGVEEESEDLVKSSELRTKKFPVMAGSIVLTKIYTDESNVERSIVLEEDIDFQMSYITGEIKPLADPVLGEGVKSLLISYIPMAQVNLIIQPYEEDEISYRMTVVDDSLEITSPLALKFKLRNPQVSVANSNPFKEDNDPSKVTYDNSILPDSIQNISIRVRSGFGTPTDAALQPGVTGTLGLGVDTDIDFDISNYMYDEELKEIQLDEALNNARPDFNDLVVMTYSFIGDTLPYFPVEALYPLIAEGSSVFYIDGLDRTDLLKTGSLLRVNNLFPPEIYYVRLKSVSFDGESTRIEIFGSFPNEVRNPSFSVFDNEIPFVRLPGDLERLSGFKPNSSELKLRGDLLQLSEAVEADTLLEIPGSGVHRVTGITIENEIATVLIFPSLNSYASGDITASTYPVRDEGVTTVTASLGVLTDPLQPAFTISFVPPTSPVELSGRGLITIDNEKIILQEIVSGFTNPTPYNFYFKDYGSIYAMAKAIQATKSTIPGLNYNPFTISVNGQEQYYLGEGSWASDTIISFEEGAEENLPYTVTINPDMYKYKVINILKDVDKFTIEEKDVSSRFSSGNLLAFTSRITGDTYYHIVSEATAEENESDGSLTDTIVVVKDNFRINFSNPLFYRYGNPVWLDLDANYIINANESSLIFSSDLTRTLRSSMFLKFGNTYVYKVESVEYDGTSTIVGLSPGVVQNSTLLISQENYPGYIKYTDIPLYINSLSHQPSLTFSYREVEAHTGYAEILIDDDKIVLYEYVDGSETVSKTTELEFINYDDIYQLGLAVNAVESSIPNNFPFSVNVESYKELYERGTFERLTIVPTFGVRKRIGYTALVAKSTFKIDYILSTGYTGTASVKRRSDRLFLKEDLKHTVGGVSEQEYTLVYSDYETVYDLINAVNSIISTITGDRPFSVGKFTGDFDTKEFFTRGVYRIPATVEDEYESLPQNIPATTPTASWELQGPLNIRRLTLDEDYSIDGGLVTFTEPIQRYERYILNYMGLNTLSDFENEDIEVFCRFFSELPVGSRVDAYMDYLNIDQYYIQKLTERKFLEIVSVPQITQLIRQKSGGGGSGADSGSNDSFPNFDGGVGNLYYLLRDEQIKKLLYLKIYKWYKKRLRYFAAEAQISTGFKFGNSTHYFNNGGFYSLLDSFVDNQLDYTLTTQENIDQIDNGFSIFFPIGYKGVAPQYHERFRDEYYNYTSVYCYNVRDVDNDTVTGKVKSWKPYWAPKKDGKVSYLDHQILKNQPSSIVGGFPVSFYDSTFVEGDDFKDELIFDSDSNNYSILKRVEVGDNIRINNKKNYYKIGAIENTEDTETLSEKLVLEEGSYFKENNVKTYNVSRYNDVPGLENNQELLYRFSFGVGFLASDSEREEFTDKIQSKYPGGIKKVIYNDKLSLYKVERRYKGNLFSRAYIDIYVTFDVFERALADVGFNIYIKRQAAPSFPVYNDEGNYGFTVKYDKIQGQITGSNRIKKPLTPLEVLSILIGFPLNLEAPEYFTGSAGTYDELTGSYIEGSFDEATNAFDSTDAEAAKVIDLSQLNFFEERRVDANLDAIRNNVINPFDPDVSGEEIEIDGVTYNVGDLYPSRSQKGFEKYFYVDFERKYVEDDDIGYIDSISLRTKNRDYWVQFIDDDSDDNVTGKYGLPTNQILKGFYDPNNIYMRLVLEKQAWITEQLIIEDIYDVQLKMGRVFKEAEVNARSGKVVGGREAFLIDYSPYRQYLLEVGNAIKTRIERYLGLLSFLLRNTPGDLGPLRGIVQEDSASAAIIESYERTTEAINQYSAFLAKTRTEATSFYESINKNIETWTNDYIRWVLSLKEGTVFQNQARSSERDGSNIIVGAVELDAIQITYEASTDLVVVSDPQVSVTKDRVNNTLQLNLRADYQQAQDLEKPIDNLKSGTFAQSFSFISYPTLSQLVSAINNVEYPIEGVPLFRAELAFNYYPKGEYATARLSEIEDTDIPLEGLSLQALNVDDHREHDSRVLYLYQQLDNVLDINAKTAINPWPTYISYYIDPNNEDYADEENFNPKKEAIQGLRVPGQWETLSSSFYEVINVRPLQNNLKASYTISSVYDEEELDDLVNEQKLNLILPDRTKVNRMVSIINKIDEGGKVTVEEYEFISETNRDKETKTVFVKFLTIKLTDAQGLNPITVRFNTRRFRTINQLVTAMNGYFYQDVKGEWIPAERAADVSQAQYRRLFEAELIGDPLDQGESSTFEIEIPYEQVIRNFEVGPYIQTFSDLEEEYYVEKKNIALGWVPEIRSVDAGGSIVIRLNEGLEYSPGNTYAFNAYSGESARLRSLKINPEHPNANILPFDLYSWDSSASYRVQNNWLFLVSANTQAAIPLTGAVGQAAFNSTTGTFNVSGANTYPELEGETVGDLVERVNASPASEYFYANLKFVRDVIDDSIRGYFEYGYLADGFSEIPKSTLEDIKLADDGEVFRLTPNRAENSTYTLNRVVGSSPAEADSLTLTSNVRALGIARNTSAYKSISNAIYNIDPGGSSISLSADYEYEYSYYKELTLSAFSDVSELVNGSVGTDGINDLEVPLLTGPTVNIFNASSILGAEDPDNLKIISETSLPVTLQNVSNTNILSISVATIADPRVSVSSATVQVLGGKLILKATLTYNGSFSGSVPLGQALSSVSSDIASLYPLGDNGTYFSPLFVSSIDSSYYNGTLGTNLNTSSGPQALVATVYGTVSVSETVNITGTLEDFIKSINIKAPATGIDATYLFSENPGYKGLSAKYVTPSDGDSYDAAEDLTGPVDFGALFSSETGLRLLFLEEGGSYEVDGANLVVITPLGTQTIALSDNRDLETWIGTLKGDLDDGLRSIDVIPVPVDNIVFGRLQLTDSTTSDGNEATHVYFGFLGDFNFYQISDYNLFTELSRVKQRLGKPWKDGSGNFVDDWYNNINYYNDFYGRTGVADGNTIALHIDKFLGYIKNTRFNEIKTSINDEQIINNKYLWLYLKLHREIGCDQKVRDYLKRIEEDEEDADQLPQDL